MFCEGWDRMGIKGAGCPYNGDDDGFLQGVHDFEELV